VVEAGRTEEVAGRTAEAGRAQINEEEEDARVAPAVEEAARDHAPTMAGEGAGTCREGDGPRAGWSVGSCGCGAEGVGGTGRMRRSCSNDGRSVRGALLAILVLVLRWQGRRLAVLRRRLLASWR
jgi:hypothetical protein